jgi:hypothetical protein
VIATSYSAPHCAHWNSPKKRSFQASPILKLCAAGNMLQGTIDAFGDRILSSAEEIGRCYSRFREQVLRIRKGNASHHWNVRKREIIPAQHSAMFLYQIWDTMLREVSMTFAIHAWKDDQSIVTVRIGPAVAVDKARVLERSGWKVHVTDSTGHRFDPSDFDYLSSFARETA